MTAEQRVDSIAKWSNTGMRAAVVKMLEEALAEQESALNEKLKMATDALAMKERCPVGASDDPRPRMEKACERLSEPL